MGGPDSAVDVFLVGGLDSGDDLFGPTDEGGPGSAGDIQMSQQGRGGGARGSYEGSVEVIVAPLAALANSLLMNRPVGWV